MKQLGVARCFCSLATCGQMNEADLVTKLRPLSDITAWLEHFSASLLCMVEANCCIIETMFMNPS